MPDSAHPTIEVRALESHRLDIVAAIDRSEEIRVGYSVGDGELIKSDGHWSVPPWDLVGDGEHSVARIQQWLTPILARGAILLGAFEADQPVGMAVVQTDFKDELAWLAALWVTKECRRHGVASALWARCVQIASDAGARSIYVSSAPTGAAVGFYLRQGCELAPDPDPELFAFEPEDIHLTCGLH
ncbi:MAG: GNAT family N-acetyltransferase [bacterium]|nr:GNAT family N-acetyltransferase [bacterium]